MTPYITKSNIAIRREAVRLSPQAFSMYRSRLIRQGVLEADGYGRIEFALPRFDAFVREQDSLML